jgi:hypothetical protein
MVAAQLLSKSRIDVPDAPWTAQNELGRAVETALRIVDQAAAAVEVKLETGGYRVDWFNATYGVWHLYGYYSDLSAAKAVCRLHFASSKGRVWDGKVKSWVEGIEEEFEKGRSL